MRKAKHTTLCFECEWAAGKEKKCPWASKFEPVPGWKAIPTKIDGNGRSYNSFDVYECPLFELMHEIKEGIVSRIGKRPPKINIKNRKTVYGKMVKMRSEGATLDEIADCLYCDTATVRKILKRMGEGKENE